MKNHLIEQLKEHMITDLEAAIDEREPEILAAIQKLREDRPDDDEKPLVFSASMGGKLNLDKNTVETAFSFSVKTTVKEKHTIANKDQVELPFATVVFNNGEELMERLEEDFSK